MIKHILLKMTMMFCLFLLVMPDMLAQQKTAMNIADLQLRALVPTLESKVSMPIRLPASIKGFPTVKSKVFLRLGEMRPQSYSIVMESVRNCNASRSCFVGSISGYHNSETVKMMLEYPDVWEAVKLAKNIKGYYQEGPCGINCGPGTLIWKQGGYYYEVSMMSQRVSDLIAVANSMIVREPVNEIAEQ